MSRTRSFPLNLKIREPDEFDFALMYEVQRLPSQPKNMAVRPILHAFYTHIRDILDNCDVLATEKNHAVNAIIFWSCHCEQEHAVHIDLAFSTKKNIIVEDYLKDKGLPLRGTPFENCLQGGPQKCPNFSLVITFTKIRTPSRFFSTDPGSL